MREEEGAHYLSPLVKQDLAKLDTDGDTRRLAVKSLKLFAEQLDASTLPRFISQIAESREPGATRCYAISMYEEVARVHGQLVVPHIPKIMAALVRSAAASGSFPQLQVACSRVTATLAQHCIDSTTSQDEAEEIMWEICAPLIDALAGKLEPVAATAAACIHALAESEKWKHAREEMVHDVCHRLTVVLGEKTTRTAAHIQLIRVLATVNPDVLCLYGANLLRAGEDILKGTANPWQLRKAAAQLLQSVLTILDKDTLEMELNSALHALDSCRLDRISHVRAAVSEAVHIAKMLASGSTGTRTSIGMALNRKSHSDRSTWLHEDHVPTSPASKRSVTPRAASKSPARGRPRAASSASQESQRLTFSSASTSASESVHALRSPARNLKNIGFRAKRAPLYPARTSLGFARSPRTPGASPSSSTTSVEECRSPSRRLNVKDFNVQSRSTIVNGHVHSGENVARHGDKSLRPRAPLTDVKDSYLPLLEFTTSKSQKIREDSGLTQFATGSENARPNSSSGHVEVVLPRLKLTTSEQHERSSGERMPMLKTSSMGLQSALPNDSEAGDTSSHETESVTADVEVEKRQIFTPEPLIHAAADGLQPSSLKNFHKPLTHLDVNLDVEEKTLTKDFLPFLTPKRLVRSLSSLSVTGSAIFEQDMKLTHDERSPSKDADGGAAETASETGWSVRDNPIASEESDEETRCGCGYEASPRLFSDCSPREIRMISPSKSQRSLFDLALPTSVRSPDHEADHPSPSYVSAERTIKQTFRSPVKDMGASIGLPSLLHKDEINLLGSSNITECSESRDQETDADDALETESEQGLMTNGMQNWRKLCWFAETALGGSLCLFIALPVAMIIAKTLNESLGEPCLLVPT